MAALVFLVVVLAAAAAVAGFFATRTVRAHLAAPTPSPTISTPPAVREATAAPQSPPGTSPGTSPKPGAVAAALRPELDNPGLGKRLRADVVDLSSGRALFAEGTTAPAPPASTAKLLTAAAVLTVHPPSYRIPTVVRAGAPGTVVLVGGGDPTLTGAAAGKTGAYPQAARISDLAAQLKAAHVAVKRIVVDDSLYRGPAISPAWAPEDVPSSYASAIYPLLADGGRPSPHAVIRSADPDVAAGSELAAALGTPELPVTRTDTHSTGRILATVHSAPLSTLVEQMLQESDNVIAECLARQVALARHRPASFGGSAAAIRQVLHGLGVDVGDGMVDGSGLAAADRLTVQVLTELLRVLTVTGSATLHEVIAALPVAAWSGTLDTRYLSGAARSGAGLVRAKTGTLTGVSSLAGVVHDRGGRLLGFAFIADRVASTPAADDALDELSAALARCTCR